CGPAVSGGRSAHEGSVETEMTVDPYRNPRPDRTPLYLLLGLFLLALLGWALWALSVRDEPADVALQSERTTVTTSALEPERDVALEARRQEPPTVIQVNPTVEVPVPAATEPPTTGPNMGLTTEPPAMPAPEVATAPEA